MNCSTGIRMWLLQVLINSAVNLFCTGNALFEQYCVLNRYLSKCALLSVALNRIKVDF